MIVIKTDRTWGRSLKEPFDFGNKMKPKKKKAAKKAAKKSKPKGKRKKVTIEVLFDQLLRIDSMLVDIYEHLGLDQISAEVEDGEPDSPAEDDND